jgi:hypothetical protein
MTDDATEGALRAASDGLLIAIREVDARERLELLLDDRRAHESELARHRRQPRGRRPGARRPPSSFQEVIESEDSP